MALTFSTEIVWGGFGNDRLVRTGTNNVPYGHFGIASMACGSGDDLI